MIIFHAFLSVLWDKADIPSGSLVKYADTLIIPHPPFPRLALYNYAPNFMIKNQTFSICYCLFVIQIIKLQYINVINLTWPCISVLCDQIH